MTGKELLKKLNACQPAREWADDKTIEEIWATCYRDDVSRNGVAVTRYPADTIWYLPRGDAAARIASFTGYSKYLSSPFEERAYELVSFLKAQTEASATGLPTRLHYDVPLEYAGGAGALS